MEPSYVDWKLTTQFSCSLIYLFEDWGVRVFLVIVLDWAFDERPVSAEVGIAIESPGAAMLSVRGVVWQQATMTPRS